MIRTVFRKFLTRTRNLLSNFRLLFRKIQRLWHNIADGLLGIIKKLLQNRLHKLLLGGRLHFSRLHRFDRCLLLRYAAEQLFNRCVDRRGFPAPLALLAIGVTYLTPVLRRYRRYCHSSRAWFFSCGHLVNQSGSGAIRLLC